MIGKLSGILDSIGDDYVIIDVQGVGYQVHCSSRTLGTIGQKSEAVSMAIETHVRETEIKLFGFSSEIDRDWFRLLQRVQGVGAKVALAIQSTLSAGDLTNAIALQDKAIVSQAPGVGPKVAQRIVTELKDKVPSFSESAAEDMGLTLDVNDGVAPSGVSDAVSALGNLGYSSQQAAKAVSVALMQAGEDANSAVLIRLGLKELAK